MNIYVGNLPFSATKEELQDAFGRYGEVKSVNLINDRETGRFRGFGFVEMDDEEAKKAIEELNGKDMGGRSLRVNPAQEKPKGPPRQRRESW